MKMRTFSLCIVLLALATSACALTSKAGLVDIRYFSPERIEPKRDEAAPHSEPSTSDLARRLEVRLGRVSSGSNLRERIAYRDNDFEFGYYEDLRWTERPETYVRRELGRSLFEHHGLHRAVGGAAPTLDVEVIAFDDLRLRTGRAVRVQLRGILYGDSDLFFEDTFTVDRPVAGDSPRIEDVVAAMATALDSAAENVALRVQSALEVNRPTAPPAPPADFTH